MKYDRLAFAAKHRAASYMAIENPATKRLVMDPIKEAMIEADDARREVDRLNKWADGFSDAQLKERAFCEARIQEMQREVERLAKLATYWHQMHDNVHDLRLQETARLCGHNEALQEREISYRLALAYIAENDDISPRFSAIAREALERP